MQVLALETIGLDKIQGLLGHGLRSEKLIEAHEALGEGEAVHMLGHPKQIYLLLVGVPIATQALENRGAEFKAGRGDMNPRVVPGDDLSIKRGVFRGGHGAAPFVR